MLMIFYRRVINDTKVTARVVALVDGRGVEVGELKFPTKQVWSKFIGAIQRGALEIPDLEVRMENAAAREYDDNQGNAGWSESELADEGLCPADPLPIQPPPEFAIIDLEKKAAEIHKITVANAAEAAVIPAPARYPVSNAEARRLEALKEPATKPATIAPLTSTAMLKEKALEIKGPISGVKPNEQTK